MPRLSLFLLSPPRIELDSVKIDPGRRKAVALLIYLAVTEQLHSRDTLAALFWADHPDDEARASLRRALAALKAALPGNWLISDRKAVGLNSTPSLWVDLRHFHSLLAECRTHGHPEEIVCASCLSLLSETAHLYHDDFLSGFNLPDCPDFDEWVFFQREQLRQEFARVLERLSRGHGERGEFEPAVAYSLRWLQLDPLEEAAHRQLMRLYAWSDRRADALRQYAACQQLLREIDTEPDAETSALFEAIQSGRLETWSRPTLTAPLPLPKSLPLQPTAFVGRSAELETIISHLHDANCRLVTLVGPGGTGKTRLALRVGELQMGEFTHGVHFVPLAALTTPSLLVPAVADGIGFTFYTQGDLKTQLLSYLSNKQMLLILDNFEHLLDSAAFVSDLLVSAPSVKVICTSRERLNIHDEWVIPVLEMRYPDEIATFSPEEYDAVQLFMQSARAVQPAFNFAPNQAAIIRICQQVQGMPLALDLAAGWLHLLSAPQIAERLARNFDLLSSTARDVPQRHRNLRLILDETWQMLAPSEQQLLRQLAVFRGDFSLEAMEKITQQPLEALASLTGKALVRHEPQDRYSLHELLRQYAAEQAQAYPQEHDEVLRRFCTFYAGIMAAQEAALHSDQQKSARAIIDWDIDNVRAAWHFAAAHGMANTLDQMAVTIDRYYEARGWLKERADLFTVAFESLQQGGASDLILARLRAMQGWSYLFTDQREAGYTYLRESLSWLHDLNAPLDTAPASIALAFGLMTYERQYEEAEALLQDSLKVLAPLHERRALEAQAEALLHLGRIASLTGAYPEARKYDERSLALGQRVGNPLAVAEALSAIGVVAIIREAFDEAKHWLEEALVLDERYEHKVRMVKDLHRLAVISMRQQHHAEAVAYYERCLTLYRDLNDRKSENACLIGLGVSAYYQKDYETALHYYREALALARELGDQEAVANALSNIGIIYWDQGNNNAEAKRLTQESLAIHRSLGVPAMVATTLASLGIITYSCHEEREAYGYLWEALQLASTHEMINQVLNACSWMPFCLVHMGDLEMAYKVYKHMLAHPEFSVDSDLWRTLADELIAQVPPEIRAVVDSDLPNLTFDAVIAELLAHPPN